MNEPIVLLCVYLIYDQSLEIIGPLRIVNKSLDVVKYLVTKPKTLFES